MSTQNYTRRSFLRSMGIGAASLTLPELAVGEVVEPHLVREEDADQEVAGHRVTEH